MTQVFDAYAAFYDLLYKDKDYVAEAAYVADRIQDHAPGASSILELGCGTGGHAAHLAQLGYTVSGIDSSPRMLERAVQRRTSLPEVLAKRLRFGAGDVRSYRAGETFDVVLSLFHVFSYQTTNADLAATFETAAAHLAPAGVLLFDFWYGPAVLTQRPEVRVKRLQDDEIDLLRIAEPVVYLDQNRVRVNYTVQIKDKTSSQVYHLSEAHDMRYLFLPEIALLSDRLFRLKSKMGWMKTTEPSADDWSAACIMERLP